MRPFVVPLDRTGPLLEPVGFEDTKDPCPVFDGRRWHIFGSGGSSRVERWKVLHAISASLDGPWVQLRPAELIGVRGEHVAAPGVAHDGERFHMFVQTEFSALGGTIEHLVSDDGGLTFLRLATALGSIPDGPEASVYDPHPAAIGDDRYLVYAAASVAGSPDIHLARSRSRTWAGPWDRLGPILRHEDVPHHNLRGSPDYEWGLEGPQLVALPGGHVLLNAVCFLPGGEAGTRQRVFFALADDVTGPWTTLGPVIAPGENPTWESGENGHAAVVADGDHLVVFYQGRERGGRWRYGIARFAIDGLDPIRRGTDAVAPQVRYGSATADAIDNFPISGWRVDGEVLAALAEIKAASALANADLQAIDGSFASAIETAALHVAAGARDGSLAAQLPVDVFQTGSGTSSNMNVNEVVASFASDALGVEVHPNDHVNRSQSSNDTFVAAAQLGLERIIRLSLRPALDGLIDELSAVAARHAGVVKLGRTHTMDAVPMRWADEIGAWRSTLVEVVRDLDERARALTVVPLGGTAIGSGINAPTGFAERAAHHLSVVRGTEVSVSPDRFSALSSRHRLEATSAALRQVALAVAKIADDLRWAGSGPNGGLAEVHLARLQAGSSIMPGKVNPVVCESVLQVAAQVVGNDASVVWAHRLGAFQLHVGTPLVAHVTCTSARLLASVTRVFSERVIARIEPDPTRMRAQAEASPALLTALAPEVGYDAAAAMVEAAAAEGRPVAEVARERLGRDLGSLLDVDEMSRSVQAVDEGNPEPR